MRSGKEYRESLDDGRAVHLNGETIRDVAAHPAFCGVVETVAGLYDFAADPSNEMAHQAVGGQRETNKVFMIPRSVGDLRARREAITKWSQQSCGFLGRSPDHVGGFLAGFASDPGFFDRDGREFGANVERFHRRVADEDLFVSYVIIPPQMDSGVATDEHFTQVGVLEERDNGMVVRGAQMLGTATAVSDYLFVSCIKPLGPQDERYAISFVVPVGAPGIHLLARRPYALGQPSRFDYPLSTRFDETDALVVFDDVLIPWEDVFVYRDVDAVRNQWHATPAHVLGNAQAQIRLATKMKFLAGLAHRIATMNGIIRIPSVQEKLADMASLASMVEGMVIAAESNAVTNDHGVVHPNPRFLYATMGLQAELYPRALQIIRELAGAGVLQVPASRDDLTSDETRGFIDRYIRSPGVDPEDRIQLFKLVWDAVGSEFGGRHHQYEMFYAGAPFVAKGYTFRNYGFGEAEALVDEFLHSYALDD